MRTVHGWLLRLYPASFYHGFARDMCADFDDGYGAARRFADANAIHAAQLL